MKNFKKFLSFFFVLSFVSLNTQVQFAFAENEGKVNICHTTGSQNNPWNGIQIDNSALSNHLDHGDFLYDGPTKDGKPDNKNNTADNWCKTHIPGTGQISPTKIICDNESDLPNWGNNGPSITAGTAQSFLNSHPDCHESHWVFEWALDGTANPGNNIVGPAGSAWHPFDQNDLPEVPEGKKVWVREQMQNGYIPFSGATSNLNSTNAKNSAEMYCNTDVQNYDNYDSISSIQKNHLYHCISFNVQIDVCPNISGKQTTVPEGMHLNEQNQCVPDTATVHATKVVCDNEFDLPNWGSGGADITATTATDYVAHNSSCHIIPWIFEWAPEGTGNPGDNVTVGGGSWVPFSSGTVQVPVGNLVWLREQLPNTYHQFSGATTDLDGTNAKRSAEFYCNSDVLNYDNYDYISPVVANANYYCVGFNTLKPTKADGKVHIYKYIDGVQATDENANSVSFPMYKPDAPGYPFYLGPNSDEGAGDIHYESSTYNMIGGESYSAAEDLTTTLVGSSCSNQNKPSYELVGYTTGKTLQEAQNGVRSLTIPTVTIDGDSTIIVWNKKCVDEVIDVCPQVNGIQTEGPCANNICTGGGGTWNVDTQTCEQNQCGDKVLDVVSDDTNTVDGVSATPIASPHGAWTSIPGATWIWNNLNDFLGGTQQTKSFSKSFTVVGNPVSASLDVAADNSFVGSINGNGSGVIADPTEFNYNPAKTFDVVSYITSGLNSISFDVTNFAVEGSTFESNPAGLIYKLHVVSNDCPETPKTGILQVKKVIVGDQEANPSNFSFKIDGGDPVAFESDGQNDVTVSVGTHTVTEVSASGYNTTYDNCSSVNITENGTAMCTVTNTKVVIDEHTPVCSDGQDNDDDGLKDDKDPACHTDHNVNNPGSYDGNIDSEVYQGAQCSDGISNDNDGLVDSLDPGCKSGEDNSWNPNDNDETDPVTTSGSGGRGGGGFLKPQGQVLGASTSCGIYVDKFLRRGYKNDVEAVKKLQKFLNDTMEAGIKEDGKFGLNTEKYLKKFQLKHADTVLSPWGFKVPTGIFYITTQTEVNNIMCPDLKLTIPTLTPIELNPLAPKKED